jgi:small subunit ribosomal protein S6
MLIITPDHEEKEAEALIENVKGIIEGGGNLINVDIWGKRRLAYPIQKRTEGYYVVYVFESEASFIAELNQALRVIEAILRRMIVLYEDDVEKLKTAEDEAATPAVSDGDTAEDITESVEDTAVPDENTDENTVEVD